MPYPWETSSKPTTALNDLARKANETRWANEELREQQRHQVTVLPDMAPKQKTNGGTTTKTIRAKQATTVAVRQPTARGGVSRNRVPRSLNNIAFNGLVITHCEPFATTGFTALGVLSYATTPIIPPNFSFLNPIAANFSKYSWLRLHLYYVPACPTTTQGECAMGNYYDQQDASSATFVQTSQMKNGISFPPWGGGPEVGADAVTIDVDCKDFDKPRYNYVTFSTWNALSTSDRNNYTPVNLAVACQGSTAAVTLAGRIWCSYSIRLIDPIPGGLNA